MPKSVYEMVTERIIRLLETRYRKKEQNPPGDSVPFHSVPFFYCVPKR